jgi:hypothetical protein
MIPAVKPWHNAGRKLAYVLSSERTWENGLGRTSIGDRLQRPCYLSRVDHDRKIRRRKQRTDIGKYSFLNGIFSFLNFVWLRIGTGEELL